MLEDRPEAALAKIMDKATFAEQHQTILEPKGNSARYLATVKAEERTITKCKQVYRQGQTRPVIVKQLHPRNSAVDDRKIRKRDNKDE